MKTLLFVVLSFFIYSSSFAEEQCKIAGFTNVDLSKEKIKTGFPKNSKVFCVGGFLGGLWKSEIAANCDWLKLKRSGATSPKKIAVGIKEDLYERVGKMRDGVPIVIKAHSMGVAVTLEMQKMLHKDLKSSKRTVQRSARRVLVALEKGGLELHQGAARGTPHLDSGLGRLLARWTRQRGIPFKAIGDMDPKIAEKNMKENNDFCDYLKGPNKEIRHIVISSYATKKDLEVGNGQSGTFNRFGQKVATRLMNIGSKEKLNECSDGYVDAKATRLSCTNAAYLYRAIHFLPRLDSTDIEIAPEKTTQKQKKRKKGRYIN